MSPGKGRFRAGTCHTTLEHSLSSAGVLSSRTDGLGKEVHEDALDQVTEKSLWMGQVGMAEGTTACTSS